MRCFAVNRAGYYIDTGFRAFERPRPEPEPVLREAAPSSSSEYKRYRANLPNRRKNLFEKFAQISSRDDVIRFANAHGVLGVGLTWCAPPEGGGCFLAEPLAGWLSARDAMREAVTLWDMCQNNRDALKEVIRWNGIDTVRYQSPLDEMEVVITSPAVNPHLLERFNQGSVIEPTFYLVQRWINENLRKGCELKLLWDSEKVLSAWDVVPVSLLGAMWKRFAEMVASSEQGTPARVGFCGHCHKEFVAERKSKRYCDDKCRARAFRGHQSKEETSKR